MPGVTKKAPAIRAHDISFRYGTETVLEDVSFAITAGDYVGIVGSNGSGKTTLLRIFLGLAVPASGTVELFGTPLREFSDWGKIGYVPQNVFRAETAFPATVREVVESGHLGERTKKPCPGKLSSRCDSVKEALERTGILHLEKRRIGELSGGERQRVFIARALLSDPELLVLDEPTTGIDAASEAAFYDLLRKLHQEGMTIILVSHDLEVIAQEVKTVICLNRRIVCMGDPKYLNSPDVLKEVYGAGKQFLSHQQLHN